MTKHAQPSTGRSRTLAAGAAGLAVLASALVTLVTASPARAAVPVQSAPSAGWSVDGRVYATELVGNVVYVGGDFDTVTSPSGEVVARANLAAFRMSDGALVRSWRADANLAVHALESDGTSVWVGGYFTTIEGQSLTGLAKVGAASGAVDTGFDADLDSGVRALDLVGGDLFLGGSFLTVGDEDHVRVAKVSSASGAVVSEFTASANGAVHAVVKSPTQDVLYVAGDYATLSGAGREGLGGVSTLTGAVSGPAFNGSHRPSLAVDVSADGDTIYAGAGGGDNDVHAWDTSTGQRVWAQTVKAQGDVQSVRVDGDRVYVGFHQGYTGFTNVRLLVADAATGAIDPSFQPRFGVNDFYGVFSIEVSAAGLIIGGEFSSVAGVTARGWARFLPASAAPSTPPTTGPTMTAKAYAGQVRRETNHQRSTHGAKRLKVDRCLQKQAVKLAKKMAEADRFKAFRRGPVLVRCGMTTASANRAAGYKNPRAVVRNNWMARKAPRLRVLDKDYRLTGVAARSTASGRWYVVQIFGVAD